MDTRRSFLKKAGILTAGAGFLNAMPPSIQKAFAINPDVGSSFYDAEHIVFLMQENRSFDHTFGTLQGVRGFNDPRAISLPNKNKVWLQTDAAGNTYAPFRLNIKDTRATWMGSLPHSWGNQVDARNDGHYDKWLDVKKSGSPEFKDMPLTLGYYDRRDIPFYYSLADAFTVCDHNFCSSLTGTTPNRLYFWTGMLRHEQSPDAKACVYNGDADDETMVSWKTYPERLEEAGVSWKVYQNELWADVGLGEAKPWLDNYGDNPLEYFTQYNVKLSPEYIAWLPRKKALLTKEINELQANYDAAPDATKKEEFKQALLRKKKALDTVLEEQTVYTKEKFEALSDTEKSIHTKAFCNNRNDPFYHELTDMQYMDGDTSRQIKIPKGDILHQFREDVKTGKLPTVSWIAAPERFSDHPSSAWFGAWYISEVMDILTENPDVWKKTIFVLTYDENDGYFDHVAPFTAPNPYKEGTGKVSEDIDASLEFVRKEQQSRSGARESSIGLGYRVPMIIASPWSRGGFVNSQVFDHTSSLQFLENFLEKKTGKKIMEPNISQWRRAVCGDLTSAFRQYTGEITGKPEPLNRERFIQSINNARFKQLPSGFKKLSPQEVADVNTNGSRSAHMPTQEKGVRPACALPYELYADGNLTKDKNTFSIALKCDDKLFGKASAGAPFYVYALNKYGEEQHRSWNYAVKPGDTLKDDWKLSQFDGGQYHLSVHGPNGFIRSFKGDKADPLLTVQCSYESSKTRTNKSTSSLVLSIRNDEPKQITITVADNSYKSAPVTKNILPGATATIKMPLASSYGWYDVTVKAKGYNVFEKQFAGKVESGVATKTDPLMGGVV